MEQSEWVCGDCDGKGWLVVAAFSGDSVEECPLCKGRGTVWPEQENEEFNDEC